MVGILKSVYPKVNWKETSHSPSLYENNCSKPHLNLIKKLQNLQIAEDIKVNYKHPILKHSTQYPIEFDIFIPSLKMVKITNFHQILFTNMKFYFILGN